MKETDFSRTYKRDKAFCTIGRFEVTVNFIPEAPLNVPVRAR